MTSTHTMGKRETREPTQFGKGETTLDPCGPSGSRPRSSRVDPCGPSGSRPRFIKGGRESSWLTRVKGGSPVPIYAYSRRAKVLHVINNNKGVREPTSFEEKETP
ncbi:hypothetical protein CDL15_Pgr023873 [Punica granatum]|uniref:Uncharacterized protein n=1 Tax=Punica granatum TaxID=22663 RepID=A0A218XHE4_PUNGR|nr:hypothetical protein CDL15_Pgr023873 [Punica granatum]